MIIKGGSRSNGKFFAKHLTNDYDEKGNDRAELKDMRGVAAKTVDGFFRETAAVASGTHCKNFFYHANINPQPGEQLTPAQWIEAVDMLEKNLGLEGQPRFVMEHEKEGRTHRHVVWSRIDIDSMTARDDSLTYRIHERTSREIENKFDLVRGHSVLEPDRATPRPERRPEDWAGFRAQKSGIDPAAIKAEMSELWRTTDSGRAFASAVAERGYVLARGDRRDFVLIDHAGSDHSLARRLDGAKAADVRERMADVDRNALPSVTEARTAQQDRFTRDGSFDRAAALSAWENRYPEPMPQRTLEPARDATSAPDHSTAEIEQTVSPQSRAWRALERVWSKVLEATIPLQPEPDAEPARPVPQTARARIVQEIHDALERPASDMPFAVCMHEAGITFARATTADIERVQKEYRERFASQDSSAPREPPRMSEGDLFAVTRNGKAFHLNPSRVDTESIQERLSDEQLESWQNPQRFAALPPGYAFQPRSVAEVRGDQEAARAQQIEQRRDERTTAAVEKWEDDKVRFAPQEGGQSLEKAGSQIERGALSVTDNLTGALSSLADFVCDLLAGPSEPPKPNRTTHLAQLEARERTAQALENLRESIERGDTLRGEDLRNLTPEHLKSIAMHGDDAMRALVQRDNEDRERDRSYGREL